MRLLAIHKPMRSHARVFPDLQDHRAFIDKLVLSVNGELAKRLANELRHLKNSGIFRRGTDPIYSRVSFGDWRLTGNPVTVLTGKTKNFENVPDSQVTMRSELSPLTGSQARLFPKRISVDPPEITVSSLELTFDLSGTTVGYFWRHVIHRAHREHNMYDDHGCRTFYVGSPSSAWQVRIYDKTESVVRLEFILRRRFLRAHGIHEPEDILLLRKIEIWKFLSVRNFSKAGAECATRKSGFRDVVLTWPMRRRLQGLVRFLAGGRIEVDRVLKKTRLQRTLEAMQRNLYF